MSILLVPLIFVHKPMAITMTLAAILGGFDHIYLGRVKKGSIIFGIGRSLRVRSYWLLGSIGTAGFWSGKIFEAHKIRRRLYLTRS